jgi:hypothetical protein
VESYVLATGFHGEQAASDKADAETDSGDESEAAQSSDTQGGFSPI